MAIRELDFGSVDEPGADRSRGIRITRCVRIVTVLVSAAFEGVAVSLAAALVAPVVASVMIGVSFAVILVLTRRSRDRLNLYVLDDLPAICLTSFVAVFIGRTFVEGFGGGLQPVKILLVVITASFLARSMSYVIRRYLQATRWQYRNTIVVGGGEVAALLVASMEASPSLGLRPVAMLDDFPTQKASESEIPVQPMRWFEPSYIEERGIDTIIVAFSGLREPQLLSMLRAFDKADCEIYIVPRLFEYATLSGDMDHIRGIPLVRVRRLAHRTVTWRLKRYASMLLAAAALVLLSPILGAVALAVWLQDRSAPVLFRQTRITENGSEFTILKFRSMKPANENESATRWNIAQDDRLGKLGRFLRKTSLDELPQLLNVVKGDMDLVGPRPERPHFAKQFEQDIPGYGARHRIPAGLTGWAAIHGLRGDTSLLERAVYDNYYIENWSLWLDIKIMIRTGIVVLRRTGG